MKNHKVTIDTLIEIVSKGGTVKTGIDIYNKNGILLIEKDIPITNVNVLLKIKENGVLDIPIDPEKAGGIWDYKGNMISLEPARPKTPPLSEIEVRIRKINQIKKEAGLKYRKAQDNIKKVIDDIKKTGGEFDYDSVEKTVTDLLNFLTIDESAFSYLTKEIFSYDDYLYNHSINVCTIATAVLNRFNDRFSSIISKYMATFSLNNLDSTDKPSTISYIQYQPEDLNDIAIGFFLHDVGKVLIPDHILNKAGRLTDEEFEIIKTHTFEKGISIIEKNKLNYNPLIRNIVKYHHSELYAEEQRCYPNDKTHIEVPIYVKLCKLADIFDAMTSKRCYKEALNPILVVTEIFRQYSEKTPLLQFLLHTFMQVVGIYPSGSIITLQNGQLAYIMDSKGPIGIPFTDRHGLTLKNKPDPMNLESQEVIQKGLGIDRRKPIKSLKEAYNLLPGFLREAITE